MRKKNKTLIETEKNQAEIKAREEESKRAQEERDQRKQKQTELTNNLRKTYSHIRPTIIQGQRILKIIESFEESACMLKVLSSRNLACIKPSELGLRSDVVRLMDALKSFDSEYSTLKDELCSKRKEFEAYAEDDEEGNEQDTHVLINDEQEKILAVMKAKEDEVELLSEQYKKRLRELLRLLEEDRAAFAVLTQAVPVDATDSASDDNILRSCYEIIVSLKFVFLKKLSTGFDEEETHKTLMERLRGNIDQNSKLLQGKESELRAIIEERASSNAQKNEEIKKCRSDLVDMKQQQLEKSKALDEEYVSKRQKTKSAHEERKAKLKESIVKAARDLQEQEKKNTEEENGLTKVIDDSRTRLVNFTQEYDTQMKEKRTVLNEMQVS